MTDGRTAPDFGRLDSGVQEQLLRDVRSRVAVNLASPGEAIERAAVVVPEQLPVEVRHRLQLIRDAGFAVPEMYVLSASGAWDVVYSPGPVLARYAHVQAPVRQQRR